jgi:hypothetical protein
MKKTVLRKTAQVICDRIVTALFNGNETAMARQLEVKPALVNDWRRGRHAPSSGSRALITHKFNLPPEIWDSVHVALAWNPNVRNEKKSTDPELQKLFDELALCWDTADEKARRAISLRLKTLAYEASLMHWSMPGKR